MIISQLIQNSKLFEQAFVHKSYLKECPDQEHNERLEFLGDALVGFVISKMLYSRYPEETEGNLSRWKSALVSQNFLSKIALKLNLLDHLKAKKSELTELKNNERIQASLFEACLGALYLEKGFSETEKYINENFKEWVEDAKNIFSKQDPKTLFQEFAQKHLKATPTYKITEQVGPSHAPSFTVEVNVGSKVYEVGKGSSLKEAQMKAAETALKKLQEE